MNVVFVTVSCCLLLQPPAEPDPYRPRVVPTPSPPLAIEDPGSGVDPSADPADPVTDPSTADPSAPAADSAVREPSVADPASDPAAAPSPTQQGGTSDDENLAPVRNVPRQRLRPPELLAEALATVPEAELQGEPLRLVTAISSTTDRQRQLHIAQAYWQLAAAQASYHWARHERELLDQYTQQHGDSLAVQGARSAAAANIRDAQLSVAEAQQALSDVAGTGQSAMPLSVDRPHVGNYTTLFEQIFATGAPPARIRLIHRTLPIQRQAIDAHAAAIVATADAVEATGEQFETTGNGLATLLALLAQLHGERQAFILAVRRYNDYIAEYLLNVARPGTTNETLVSQLILPTGRERQAPASAQPSGSAPVQQPSAAPLQPQQPSVTLPDGSGLPGAPGAPAAPVDPAAPAADASVAAPTGDDGLPRTFANRPFEPSGASPIDAPSAESQTSNYQPADVDELLTNGGGMYRGLADLQPPARAQKLSELLHWDRALPPDTGQRIALPDCLDKVSQGERLELLAAYWQTRESVARFQALSDRADQLDALATALGALRAEPGIAEAGVRLHAVRCAAKAAVHDAHIALIDAQFNLTQAANAPLDQPWVLPATPPQSGRYVVAKHDSQPLQRSAEAVLLRQAELEQRAEAVIRADLLRANLGTTASGDAVSAADLAANELSSIDRAIWAIDQQTGATLAFLANLTRYNEAISRYALATAPQGMVGNELAKRLVIVRTVRGDS